jgi:hypothetical protein
MPVTQKTRYTIAQTILRSLIVISAVVAVVYYAIGEGMVGEVLRVTAEGPDEISLAALANGPITVAVKLENKGAGATVLTVENSCKILRWIVKAGDQFVQGMASERCPSADTITTIAKGGVIEAVFDLPLDAARYEAGADYEVVVEFWGQTGIYEFTARP